MWIEQTEGAKFWLRVMNEIKNFGVEDILLAVVDGLNGCTEAINATFPETVVQTCIVHLIHHSINFASWKDRKQLTEPAEWGIALGVHAIRRVAGTRPGTNSQMATGFLPLTFDVSLESQLVRALKSSVR